MNGSLLVSLLVLTCTFACCRQTAYGQPNGYVEIPHRSIFTKTPNGCWQGEGLYNTAKLADLRLKPNCANAVGSSLHDPQKLSLAHYRARGDCHMQIVTKVFRVDVEKKYKLVINTIYGGCRAVGVRSGWIEFEKVPADYTFEMFDIVVDRSKDGASDGFVFPRLPSVIARESLPIREVSLGCVELAGQSQWVIQNKAIILDAIKYESNETECSAAIELLDVDFERETLIGYSFASGHCGRPPGLTFAFTKETSNYLDENQVLVKATYDKAGDDFCKVWKTYPVWLVVPKQLPQHYRFGFSAEAN